MMTYLQRHSHISPQNAQWILANFAQRHEGSFLVLLERKSDLLLPGRWYIPQLHLTILLLSFASALWNCTFSNLLKRLHRFHNQQHLHQLLYFFVKKKLGLSILLSNNLSSSILILFNFLIIHICSLNPDSTIFQVKLIICSIIFYISGYFLLKRFYELNFNFKK